MNMSLTDLYRRVLTNTSAAMNLPGVEDETQELITKCLNDLKILHTRLIELALFSPNETLDDISTQDLLYLTVPYTFAEVQSRLRASKRAERLSSLNKAEKYMSSFVSLAEQYEIIPPEERALYSRKTAEVTDYAKRRELKISQYKKEKELQNRVQAIQKRRRQSNGTDDTPTDFDMISSLLPAVSSTASKDEKELDSETDDILRETIVLLLRLLYVHASTQLQSMEQELELLRHAPPSPTMGPETTDERDKKRKAVDDEWKLDIPIPGGPDGKGPLLDPTGKPLRPFTILPSEAGERARFQSQVFGPGHRLPTMTIEEYLEIERQNGNIITGGGAASQAAPTSSEQLAIDSEMDGTVEAEIKAEQKRQKEENWAVYTEANPRGAGNTMNRG